MDPNFRDGYMVNYTAGIERTVNDVVLSASYVATAGVKLASVISPNSYPGASPALAPFTQFNSSGQITGGFGQELLMGTPSHSTYHALQISATKNSSRLGLGLQSSYTLGKGLDDTSAIPAFIGGAPSGTVIQAYFQDPWNPGADKGPSTFDIAQVFTLSAIEVLPFDRISFLRPLGSKVTSGWQVLNITTLTSGSPFTVYSGIQQTGVGSAGGDRPDQVARPDFSTGRKVREDYFGRGNSNPSFFSTPIGVPGGTEPTRAVSDLGQGHFPRPGLLQSRYGFDQETTLGARARSEPPTLEFRAEFFNAFNLITFGLPVNILRGTGFGVINHTAGTSRQIQLSLKLIF